MIGAKPKIWVVGDSMLDMVCRPEHIRHSQEDGTVPVLELDDQRWLNGATAGGAANVAANLAAMDCDVTLFTDYDTADNGPGERLHQVLTQYGVGVLREMTGDPTTVKRRYYEGDRLYARIDSDHVIEKAIMPPEFPVEIPQAIIVTDYGKGAVDFTSISTWWAFAESHGIPMYGDPRIGSTWMWKKFRDVRMVANWAEAMELTGRKPALSAEIRDHVISTIGGMEAVFNWCVVKRGRCGSVVNIRQQGYSFVDPVQPRQVFDVQGAGDTYIAALVAGGCRGLWPSDAALFASAAAGEAVGQPGTAVVGSKEVVAALKASGVLNASGCVLYDAARHVAARMRGFGYRIGITNGCFDLVIPHPGHVATIQGAARKCDFLFVAVDSDARVRSLKGAGRPVNSQEDRASSVAALRGVGASFVFDVPMEEVVKDFKPDVLVKGSEYNHKPIPEAELLGEWGGELHLVPMLPTLSTTARLDTQQQEV